MIYKKNLGLSKSLLEMMQNREVLDAKMFETFEPKNNDDWFNVISLVDKSYMVILNKLKNIHNVKITNNLPNNLDCSIFEIEPQKTVSTDKIMFQIHGGGFSVGNGESGILEAVILADKMGAKTFSPDYRQLPLYYEETTFKDNLDSYNYVVNKYPNSKIYLFGTSAGGNLVARLVQYIIKNNLKKPNAIYLGTPWMDLSDASDSLDTNKYKDHAIMTYKGILEKSAIKYANNKELTKPEISPIYGSFKDFPPTYILTGTRDLFLSDSSRLHLKLKEENNIKSNYLLNVIEASSHSDYVVFSDAYEYDFIYNEITDFLLSY